MPITGFCRNANTDGPQGKETLLGATSWDQEIRNIRTGVAPVTADVDRYVTTIQPTTGGTQTFTIAAQPDVPRNVTMNLTDANSSIESIRATVKGTDPGGNPQTEVLTLINSGSAQAVGTLPFQTITSITAVTVGTVGGGDAVTFGCGTGLGLPLRLGAETDILAKRVDAVQDTTGVVTINANGWATWVPASLPNDTRKYFATIRSTYGL